MISSIIFPAFVSEYKGNEDLANPDIRNGFRRLIASASKALDMDLTGFDFQQHNFLDDELRSQYISYVFSCTVSDYLTGQGVVPSFVSGYSMGIYAALYYCRSVDFHQGLHMVRKAWEVISRISEGRDFGMGMVIGLDEADISSLIKDREDIEICNQNNPYTFILSGTRPAVDDVLSAAREDGAMKATLLPVTKPYHSQFLKEASPEYVLSIRDLSFRNPAYPYVSAMDQTLIVTGEGLRMEAARNLSGRMNWLRTMQAILSEGAESIFECGAGDGLTRNARFISGSYTSYPLEKLGAFIKAATRS